MNINVGDKVIAKGDKAGVIFAGKLYIVESVNHPSIKNSGLIKLKGVRDYWDKEGFVLLTKEIIDSILDNIQI